MTARIVRQNSRDGNRGRPRSKGGDRFHVRNALSLRFHTISQSRGGLSAGAMRDDGLLGQETGGAPIFWDRWNIPSIHHDRKTGTVDRPFKCFPFHPKLLPLAHPPASISLGPCLGASVLARDNTSFQNSPGGLAAWIYAVDRWGLRRG